MKKPKPLEVKEETPLVAKRRARIVIGPVKPTRSIDSKAGKPPKHKKKLQETDD